MSSEAARSWTHSHEESRLLRALAVLPFAVIGTGVLAVTVTVVGVVVVLFVGGSYALGVAILLAVAVMSARLAPHRIARVRSGQSFVGRLREFGTRTVTAALLVGVAVWAVGAALGQGGFVAVVVGTVLLPLVLRAVLASEGSVDPEAGTLTYCGTDIDLAALDGVRRWSVGEYVVYRLSYAEGTATFGTPRWLVVPHRVDPQVRAALESGVDATSGEVGPTRLGVRLAAVAGGVFCFGVAGLLLTVDPTSAHPRGEIVLWYVALVAGVFGVLFVSLGIRGG